MRLVLLFLLLSARLSAQTFVCSPIPEAVYQRIIGHSLPVEARIDTSQLSYLRLSYHRLDGTTAVGEMIVARELAAEVLDIFRELYDQQYPIHSIRLIDDFAADDERSMRANNTSAFCYRTTPGARTLSRHSLGRAIDINPLYNPYVKGTTVLPATARPYINRSASYPFKIKQGDPVWNAFTRRGWRWGGAWRTLKDYQHFEK